MFPAEDEKEFSYVTGSELGPEHWGEIHKEWVACGDGHMQSPIDLSHKRVRILPNLGHLRRSYRPAMAIVENRGHDIMVRTRHPNLSLPPICFSLIDDFLLHKAEMGG